MTTAGPVGPDRVPVQPALDVLKAGVPALDKAVIGALQSALRAEHAAIYGYAALGPNLSGQKPAGSTVPSADAVHARADEMAHRTSRDHLIQVLTGVGAVPVGARADYLVPDLTMRLTALSFALDLESACCRCWRYVIATAAGAPPAGTVAAGTARVRTDALGALVAAAVRATGWRAEIDPHHPTEAFPGI